MYKLICSHGVYSSCTYHYLSDLKVTWRGKYIAAKTHIKFSYIYVETIEVAFLSLSVKANSYQRD